MGLSILFREGSSLGGANILALFLQKRFNINPGKINFIFDVLVVLTSILTVGLMKGTISIISIAVTSTVISYFKKDIAEKSTIRKEKGFSLTTSTHTTFGAR